MKKSMLTLVIGLSIGFGFVNAAQAEERAWPWSPLGIGIAAPLQLPFYDSDVYGLRVGGLFGYNADVYGLDCGVASMDSGTFAGVQGAAFSWTEENAYGIQSAGLANVVNGDVFGIQAAPVNVDWSEAWGIQVGCVNYVGGFRGIQVNGIINWNEMASYGLEVGTINANQMEFTGWAFGGLVNHAESFWGFSCGLVNVAYDMAGCQLGVFNACDHMHGVQIGLINIICESKLPIMTVMNAWF